MKRIFLINLLLMLSVSIVQAEVWFIPDHFYTLQSAIDQLDGGDTIIFQPGTHDGVANFNGKNFVVGSQMLLTGDAEYIATTILDGMEEGSVLTYENGESRESLLYGLTITNGKGINGGGIYIKNSSPRLTYLRIKENTNHVSGTDGFGGGMHIDQGNPEFLHVMFYGNTSTFCGGLSIINCQGLIIDFVSFIGNVGQARGGAVMISGGDVTFKSSTFDNNSTVNGFGGAVLVAGGGLAFFEDCWFEDNSANGRGEGGVFSVNVAAELTLTRCVMKNNVAETMGGVFYGLAGGKIKVYNCTLIGNSANTSGVVHLQQSSEFLAVNSIFWDNGEVTMTTSGDRNLITMAYCDIEHGWDGIQFEIGDIVDLLEGMIYEDPTFEYEGSVSLGEFSPCIDTGTERFEFRGNEIYRVEEFYGFAPDMGAIETYTDNVRENEFHKPNEFVLMSAFPNPFNNRTNISLELMIDASVEVNITDIKGRKIKQLFTGELKVGEHLFEWDADGIPNGLYIINLKHGSNLSQKHKLTLIK